MAEKDKRSPSFITAVAEVKRKKDADELRRSEIADAASSIYADLHAVIMPHLPKLPEKRPSTREELMQRLSEISIDELTRPVSAITEKTHLIETTIASDEGEARVTIGIDGNYVFRSSQPLDITVKGMPDKYLISSSSISIESVAREIPEGVDVVFGSDYDQTRPVYARAVTNTDLGMLKDLASRMAEPSAVIRHRALDKRLC